MIALEQYEEGRVSMTILFLSTLLNHVLQDVSNIMEPIAWITDEAMLYFYGRMWL